MNLASKSMTAMLIKEKILEKSRYAEIGMITELFALITR